MANPKDEPKLCPVCHHYKLKAISENTEQCVECGWTQPIPPWELPGVIRLPRPTNPWDDNPDVQRPKSDED